MGIKLNEDNISIVKDKLQDRINDLNSNIHFEPKYSIPHEHDKRMEITRAKVALNHLKNDKVEFAEFMINEFKLLDELN